MNLAKREPIALVGAHSQKKAPGAISQTLESRWVIIPGLRPGIHIFATLVSAKDVDGWDAGASEGTPIFRPPGPTMRARRCTAATIRSRRKGSEDPHLANLHADRAKDDDE